MIVLDANILIRAVMGRRVRELLEHYASPQVQCCAPDAAYLDAEKYLPSLLRKRGKPAPDVSGSLRYLPHLVKPIYRETYDVFEDEARERLRGRHEDDWPVLATALALTCAIWTEDTGFFGTGIGVWTTNRIEIFLKAQAKSSEHQED
jgi:predicted nucleic acid-binding protein